jgi:uncharacterized RmlC-like cupin family protein
MITKTTKSKDDGIIVVRANSLVSDRDVPSATGRVTVFNFDGTGGTQTWIGVVSLQPGAKTGAHHHGRHEVAIYVTKGHSQIRWGEQLEFATEVSAGDFVYFAPYVPHQEINSDENESVDFLVVRSDDERIVVKHDVAPVVEPDPAG